MKIELYISIELCMKMPLRLRVIEKVYHRYMKFDISAEGYSSARNIPIFYR